MKKQFLPVILALTVLSSACTGRPPEPQRPATAPVEEPVQAPPSPPSTPVDRVVVSIRQGSNAWREVESGSSVPQGPYSLQIRLPNGSQVGALEHDLRRALENVTYTVKRLPPDGLEVDLPEPPPVLSLFLPDAVQSQFTLNTGESPRLVVLNPTTGEEHKLAEIPLNGASATVSRDGRWILVETASPTQQCASQVWEVDTTSGKRHVLPFEAGYFQDVSVWYEGTWYATSGHFINTWETSTGRHERRESAGWIWEGVSPDGRFLSGATYKVGSAPLGGLASMTVVVLDLKTGQEKTYPDVAYGVPHAHWIDFRLRWTPDGKGLLLGHHRQPKVVETRLLDLQTGQVAPSTEQMPKPEDPVFISNPNGWQYERVPGLWGPVNLTSPEGKAYAWGEALPVGWMPDGRLLLIRWENYKHRRLNQCL